jgi:T5orf172 domain
MSKGFVYILEAATRPKIYKVGFTERKQVSERVNEIVSEWANERAIAVRLIKSYPCQRPEQFETLCHRKLRNRKILPGALSHWLGSSCGGDTEWHNGSCAEVVAVVDRMYREVYGSRKGAPWWVCYLLLFGLSFTISLTAMHLYKTAVRWLDNIEQKR